MTMIESQAPAMRRPRTAARPTTVALQRRTIDKVLTAGGALVAVVLVAAGGLLTWGSGFAADYVDDELSSQNIAFPSAEALEAEGRADLAHLASESVNTGDEAEAYASYIHGHLESIADGATYADLGAPEREARAALAEARESSADEGEIARLGREAAAITAQRDTLFKGETLRGLLLSAYAWATVGKIAGYAAVGSFLAAAVMIVLVALGVRHYWRSRLA